MSLLALWQLYGRCGARGAERPRPLRSQSWDSAATVTRTAASAQTPSNFHPAIQSNWRPRLCSARSSDAALFFRRSDSPHSYGLVQATALRHMEEVSTSGQSAAAPGTAAPRQRQPGLWGKQRQLAGLGRFGSVVSSAPHANGPAAKPGPRAVAKGGTLLGALLGRAPAAAEPATGSTRDAKHPSLPPPLPQLPQRGRQLYVPPEEREALTLLYPQSAHEQARALQPSSTVHKRRRHSGSFEPLRVQPQHSLYAVAASADSVHAGLTPLRSTAAAEAQAAGRLHPANQPTSQAYADQAARGSAVPEPVHRAAVADGLGSAPPGCCLLDDPQAYGTAAQLRQLLYAEDSADEVELVMAHPVAGPDDNGQADTSAAQQAAAGPPTGAAAAPAAPPRRQGKRMEHLQRVSALRAEIAAAEQQLVTLRRMLAHDEEALAQFDSDR
jgi:hypothetical protein